MYAPLLLRIALGSFFLLTGKAQLASPQTLVDQVQALKIMEQHLATVFALLLPYLEIIAGTLILIGFWTTLAGIVAAVLVLPFIYSTGFLVGKHVFNKDLLILAASLSLLYSGAGAVSLDRFRKGGG